jgi:hypothetical protein
MAATLSGVLDKYGPYAVMVPFQAVIFAFYGRQFLPWGGVAVVAGALVGVLWALLLGRVANRLMRRETWRELLANAPVLLGIVATGLMAGGGFMYAAMMGEVLREPSLTYDALSALMQPAVPFFIVLNSALELVLVSWIVVGNWDAAPRRRLPVLIGVLAYLAMRIWTYLVFAETRLEISRQPLTADDVAWFQQTLAGDLRIVLLVITHVSLILAAFIPVGAMAERFRAAVSGERSAAPRLAAQP